MFEDREVEVVELPDPAGTLDGSVGEVQVEDDFATGRLGGRPGLGLFAREVKRELAASDLPNRDRAADVQGVFRAEVLQGGGRGRDGGLEVESVGEVEGAVDVRGPGQPDLAGVDPEVPGVGSCLLPGFGIGGHERRDRGSDGVVQLGEADLVRERRDRPVDMGRGLEGQGHGALGDPAGLPRHEVAGHDAGPGLRQAVAELEGLADVRLPGLDRQADRHRELGDGELRHQRRTGPSHRDRLVAVPVTRRVIE